MIRTDQEGWRNSRDTVIEETHRLIREESYEQADSNLADLLKTCTSRRFDMILECEFSNTSEQMTSWLDAEIRRHINEGDCVAMQLELTRCWAEDIYWTCSCYGFTAGAFPHTREKLGEVAALATGGYWKESHDSLSDGAIDLEGFRSYVAACRGLHTGRELDKEKARDDSIAHTIAELILGVKYHRLISDAASNTANGPFWLIVQDNDSYYIPVAIRQANGA